MYSCCEKGCFPVVVDKQAKDQPRANTLVISQQVEMEQSAKLRKYFRERLQHYCQLALQLPKGADPIYLKESKD